MARLRYNNAVGTLGASLTNSGTTITFASAPSFATITSPDFIPIVLEPTGTSPSANFEIVHLTAYTAGATTGTISRGQEGTSGVAHSNGVEWACGPTVLDALPQTSNYALFTSSGTWNIPMSVQGGTICARAIGGGAGGGGGLVGSNQVGAGGGGAGMVDDETVALNASDVSLTITIGAGGSNGGAGSWGGAGGTTTVKGTQSGIVYHSAYGGNGGSPNQGGAWGAAAIPNTNVPAGSAHASLPGDGSTPILNQQQYANPFGIVVGGSAGGNSTTSLGGLGGVAQQSGTATVPQVQPTSQNSTINGTNGQSATKPGCGGSGGGAAYTGGTAGSGGSGASGQVELRW